MVETGNVRLNHTACHWREGHKALRAPRRAGRHVGEGNRWPPAARRATQRRHVKDGELRDVYCVGGRNRGHTVGVVERLCLETLTWSRAPRLNEPRGPSARRRDRLSPSAAEA